MNIRNFKKERPSEWEKLGVNIIDNISHEYLNLFAVYSKHCNCLMWFSMYVEELFNTFIF